MMISASQARVLSVSSILTMSYLSMGMYQESVSNFSHASPVFFLFAYTGFVRGLGK